MMEIRHILLLGFLMAGLSCCRSEKRPDQQKTGADSVLRDSTQVLNQLTEEEKEEGWELLFDGHSLDKWRSFGMDSVSDDWVAEDGNLVALGQGSDMSGYLITRKKYGDFELSLEWKISPEGNSGIIYLAREEGFQTPYETGPEYQIIDDIGYPEKLEPWQTTGANYAMDPPVNAKVKPVGEYNTSRIKVFEGHVEHWLNGVKVVEYDLWTDAWREKVKQGKWKDYPDYGSAREGYISLQDHGSKVWFRNIKIREIV